MYSSPRIVRVNKSRRMIQAWHVARMGERRGAYRFLVRNLRERDHFEDSGVDGRINIKMDLHEVGWGPWSGLTWLRLGTGGGNLSMR